jgi:hypothetical protein
LKIYHLATLGHRGVVLSVHLREEVDGLVDEEGGHGDADDEDEADEENLGPIQTSLTTITEDRH